MTWMTVPGESRVWLTDPDLTFQSERADPSVFKVVHYDLECFSSVAWNTGKNQMPSPEINDDVIIGIGAVVTNTNSPEILERAYFGIGPLNADQITDAQVVVCVDEQEMLSQFCRWISRVDPDIINAFNNFGFDDRYLFTRLEKYEMIENFPSRVPGRDITLKQKHFVSNAIQFDGDYIHHPLRIYFDLLLFARKEFKTEMKKFTLENVAQVLMGKGKHDVSAHEIFQAWHTRDADMLTKVAAYCIQDCCLVAEIMAYKQVYSTLFSRAELFLCDPRDLLIKGQQQIVFNLIYNQVRTHTNFTIPDSADDAIDDFLDEPGSDSEDSEDKDSEDSERDRDDDKDSEQDDDKDSEDDDKDSEDDDDS
jgi:DNA polymerase delta subunit 1